MIVSMHALCNQNSDTCNSKQIELGFFLRSYGSRTALLCIAHSSFLLELGPEHSPKLSYTNLTEEEEDEEEKEEQLDHISAPQTLFQLELLV